jgi:hypothetical protein
MFKPSLKEWAVNTAIIVLPVLFVWGISILKDANLVECAQSDIYDIKSEWSICTIEGKQTREIVKKDNFSCKNPGKVDVPEAERTCTYIPTCDEEKEPCSDNNVYLFKKGIKEHTTIIENNNYSTKNHNNLEILPHGKFKSIKLTIIADTKPVQIPEYYYVFFGIDKNYASPQVIGTSRIKDNRLDLKDYGVFQGTETPRTLKFDLNELKLAKPSGTTSGYEEKNYVETLNNNSGQGLKMTLFLADGNSMTADVNQRIFGVITDAWFEYECENNEKCSIERLPSIN